MDPLDMNDAAMPADDTSVPADDAVVLGEDAVEETDSDEVEEEMVDGE